MRALEGSSSTTKQILIDQDLRGWKEVEYEVLRRRPLTFRLPDAIAAAHLRQTRSPGPLTSRVDGV